jgi:hypothetical protein
MIGRLNRDHLYRVSFSVRHVSLQNDEPAAELTSVTRTAATVCCTAAGGRRSRFDVSLAR